MVQRCFLAREEAWAGAIRLLRVRSARGGEGGDVRALEGGKEVAHAHFN